MIICKVVGKCVSTIKCSGLSGISLIAVKRVKASGKGEDDILVAADPIGCPQGAIVLVASGTAARMAAGNREAPIDHTVVAIVDDNNYLA